MHSNGINDVCDKPNKYWLQFIPQFVPFHLNPEEPICFHEDFESRYTMSISVLQANLKHRFGT